MLTQEAKDAFRRLGCEYAPVAVKYCYAKPGDIPPAEETLSFCQFLKKAQVENRAFYIQKENDDCFGNMALGMIPKQPFAASGQAGMDFGVFRTPAPNARLHNQLPVLVGGSVNYVIFCPVALCDFDPDLVVVVGDTRQADIVMRASSYISGDLWESKTSCVMSCAWTYVYPYLSGKVNFCVTGMHHGMKRRKVYPEGLHIISIPYQKLDEVCAALGEMDWELIAMREDEESRRELSRRMDRWREMADSQMPPREKGGLSHV